MLDIKQFFQATNPAKALFADKKNHERDRQYYIDFSSVLGLKLIRLLRNKCNAATLQGCVRNAPNQPIVRSLL